MTETNVHIKERKEGQYRPRSSGEDVRRKLLEELPVAERRLRLNGIATAVLEGGDGPPVVLLHGPGEYAAKWLRVIPNLAKTHRVIAPDLPGHGASEVIDGALDAERVMGWLDDLLECTCQTPPALVGQILGGAIAVRFAIDHAERLSKLVLVDTLGLAPFQPAPEFGRALSEFMSEPTEDTHDGLWSRCAFDLDALRNQMGEQWEWIKAYNLDRARAADLRASQQTLMEQFGIPAIPRADVRRITIPTTLIWGRLVRDVKVTDDGVDLSVRYANSEESLHGDFVIGADGRASVIRARTGLKVERLPFPFDVAWFSLPLPPSQQEDPRFQAFSRGGRSVGLYPSWDGQLRLGLNVPAGASDARREMLGKDALLDEVGQVVGEPYATFIRKRKNEVADPVMLKILFGRCPQWTAKHTLILGDAAHPMSPVRAQGINLALRDAIVAANHLAAALADKDADKIQAAAERVQPERDTEIIESQRFQVAVAEPPPPARSALLRATLLPVLCRIGVIKRLFLKAEIPLRHGVVPVRLEV